MKGSKTKSRGLNSYSLWHKRLGHISQKRIDRFILEEVLHLFDLKDVETSVKCIKGKNSHTKGKGSSRETDLLQLMHVDICGPFPKRL